MVVFVMFTMFCTLGMRNKEVPEAGIVLLYLPYPERWREQHRELGWLSAHCTSKMIGPPGTLVARRFFLVE
jgi:hypothetical protein